MFEINSKATTQNDDRGIQKNDESNCTLESWLSRIDRSISKSRRIKGGNYVQIATVDQNLKPQCRTVVFRGFVNLPVALHGNNHAEMAMKMITDSRSEKVAQASINPACEMVWWFSESSEQYRISGELVFVTNENVEKELDDARKDQWKKLSDPAREQFYWSIPGLPFEGIPNVPAGGRDSNGVILDPPSNFLLMLLLPKTVKYLRLRDNFSQLDLYDPLSRSWSTSRVNP
jgi:PPOX class probable FMN-dependent enzyme